MKTVDVLIDQYYALKPAEFGFLESLELSRSVQPEECTGFTLKLRLLSSTLPKAKCLTLEFRGVRDLCMGSFEGLHRLFLEIISIREHQMEGLNYRVVEGEVNTFSFYCGDFIATVDAK